MPNETPPPPPGFSVVPPPPPGFNVVHPQELKEKPWLLKGVEFGVSTAAQMGGEAAGAFGGALTPVPGGAEVGGVAGAGVGSVAGDVANRAIDRATGYGNAPIIPTAGEAGQSFTAGAVGSVTGKVLGKIGTAISGIRAAKGAVTEAAAEKAGTVAEKQAGVEAEAATKQAVGQTVGLTPEQAAREVPFEERSTIGASGREAVKGARGARIKETGELFNPIYDPIKNNLVPHETLVSTGVQATDKVGDVLTKRGITTPTDQKATLDALSSGAKSFLNRLKQMGAPNAAGEIRAQPVESTVGGFRKLNGDIMAFVHNSNDPTERDLLRAASEPLRDYLDAVVPEAQQPLLTSLKQQYAQINKELPFSLAKRIDKATTLPEMGAIVFNPKKLDMAAELWKGANAEQKDMLKSMFAHDLMLNHGGSTKELAAALEGKGRILKMMFGGSALETAQTWVNVDARRAAMEKLVQQNPKALSTFNAGVKRAFQEAGQKYANEPVNVALSRLTKEEETAAVAKGIQKFTGPTGMASWMQHHMFWMGASTVGMAATGGSGHLGALGVEAAGLGGFLLGRKAWASMLNSPGYQKALMAGSVDKVGYAIGRVMTVIGVEASKSEPAQQ